MAPDRSLTKLIAGHLVGHIGAHQNTNLRGSFAKPLPNQVSNKHRTIVIEVQPFDQGDGYGAWPYARPEAREHCVWGGSGG